MASSFFAKEITNLRDFNDSDLRQLFFQNKLLVIRSQGPVSESSLKRLAQVFGELYRDRKKPSKALPQFSTENETSDFFTDNELTIARISNQKDASGRPLGALGAK